MILYRVFPFIYLIIFFYQSLQNYISLGVTELFFPNINFKLLFLLRRLLLQNLMDPTPRPYGSNSKTCYPPLTRANCNLLAQTPRFIYSSPQTWLIFDVFVVNFFLSGLGYLPPPPTKNLFLCVSSINIPRIDEARQWIFRFHRYILLLGIS